MAHVHALGDVAPRRRPIIHLGATSCYVTDNTDLILIREALGMVRDQLVGGDRRPGRRSPTRWKDLPCLGYTHFQPAQLVTVGKRATPLVPTTWSSTCTRSSTGSATSSSSA